MYVTEDEGLRPESMEVWSKAGNCLKLARVSYQSTFTTRVRYQGRLGRQFNKAHIILHPQTGQSNLSPGRTRPSVRWPRRASRSTRTIVSYTLDAAWSLFVQGCHHTPSDRGNIFTFCWRFRCFRRCDNNFVLKPLFAEPEITTKKCMDNLSECNQFCSAILRH